MKVPQFIVLLQPVEVTEGEDAVLECQISGAAPISVEWFKNGALLKLGNRIRSDFYQGKCTLRICKVTFDDEADYKCVARNSFGTASCASEVLVNEAFRGPEFVSRLQDVTAATGNDVCFEVCLVGTPDLQVEWFKDDLIIKDEGRYILEKDTFKGKYSLIIESVVLEDTGTYSCIVLNEAGKTSSKAKLTVTDELRQPTPAGMVQLGQQVQFAVGMGGQPLFKLEPSALKQPPRKRSPEVQEVETTSVPMEISGVVVTGVDVLATPREDEVPAKVPRIGEKVQFELGLGGKPLLKIDPQANKEPSPSTKPKMPRPAGESEDSSSDKRRKVVKSPEFVEGDGTTEPFEVTESGDVKLELQVKGEPPPRITWFKDEKPIQRSAHYDVRSRGDTHTLIICGVTADDRGTYRCTAENEEGTSTRTFDLEVGGPETEGAPEFVQDKSIVPFEVTDKGDINLTVKVIGTPPPDTQWFKDNKPIVRDSRHIIKQQKDGIFCLTVKGVTSADQGTYECSATSKTGSAKRTFDVEIDGAKGTKRQVERFVIPRFLQDDSIVPFEVTEEGNIKLQVKVCGEPRPVIEWTKDGRTVHSSDRLEIQHRGDLHSLTIFNASPSDHGTYKCIARSEAGETTRAFNVEIEGGKPPPEHFIHDESLNPFVVTEEGDVRLQVKVQKHPRPSIVWSKDDKPLSKGKNIDIEVQGDIHSLTIHKPSPEDEGTYVCAATTEDGTSTRTFEVEVEGAKEDTITLQFVQDETITPFAVTSSGDIKLQVKVSGKSMVYWSKNDRVIKPSGRIIQEENNNIHTLTIKNPTSADQGTYKCVATTEQSTATKTFKVDMKQGKPVIPVEGTVLPKFLYDNLLESFVVSKEGDITIQAKISGKPRVEWIKDGKPLINNEHFNVKVDKDVYSLRINKPTLSDSGTYTCKATSGPGTVTRNFDVEIERMIPAQKLRTRAQEIAALQVVEDKTQVPFEVTPGGDVFLRVKVMGKPTKVEWFKDEKVIKAGRNIDIQVKGETQVLIIRKPTAKDQGTYKCLATTDNSTVTRSFNVELQKGKPFVPAQDTFSPKFIENDSMAPYVLSEDGDMTLQVKISGKPKPKVEWTKDGNPLQPDTRTRIQVHDDDTYSLTIKNPVAKDRGKYTCKASNNSGSTSKVFDVEKLAKMAKPEKTFVLEQYGTNEVEGTETSLSKKGKDRPKIINDEAVVTDEGDLELKARVIGKPTPSVEWFRGETPLMPCGNIKICVNEDFHILTIIQPTLDDQGTYKCIASNAAGKAIKNFEVELEGSETSSVVEDIQVADYVSEESVTPFEVTVQGDIKLQAVVSGKPAKIEWLKDEKPILPSNCINILEDNEVHTLIIKNPTVRDEGTYKCVATTDTGSVTRSFTVDMKYGKPIVPSDTTLCPKFVEDETLEPFVISENGDITLQARVNGKPQPTVMWTKNEKSVKPTNRITISSEDDLHVLTISKPVPEDKGKYVCTATNTSGSLTRSFDVDVEGTGPVPMKEEIVLPQFDVGLASAAPDSLTAPKEGKKAPMPKEKPVKPTFVDSLATVNDDGDLILQAQVSGKPTPTIQWHKGDQPVKPSKNVRIEVDEDRHVLILIQPTLDDQGTYKCTATNNAGQAVKNFEVELEGSETSSLTEEIMETEETAGEEEVKPFEVTSTGDIRLQMKADDSAVVEWFKEDKPLMPSWKHNIWAENNIHSLTIKNPTSRDQGTYKFVETTGTDTTSRTFNVEMHKGKPVVPTEITSSPKFVEDETMKSFILTDSGDVELTVKVSGKPAPTVEWTKDGKPLKPSSRVDIRVEDNDVYKLVINQPTPEDRGTYTCTATSDTGTSTKSFVVNVEGTLTTKPSQVRHVGEEIQFTVPELGEVRPESEKERLVLPVEQVVTPQFVEDDSVVPFEVTKNNDVKLQVKTTGEPKPVIEWSKNNVPLKPGRYVDIKTEDDVSTLIVKSPAPGDKGTYKCTATSETGTATRSFDVDIKGRKPVVPKETTIVPQFVEDETVVPFEVTEEGEISLQVKVSGKPTPTVKWSKDGKTLKTSDNIDIDVDGDYHTLTIIEPTVNDQGTYTCTATSDAGTSVRSFEVDIEGAKPKAQAESEVGKRLPEEAEFSISAPDVAKTVEAPAPTPKVKGPLTPAEGKPKPSQKSPPKSEPKETKPVKPVPKAEKPGPKEVEVVVPTPKFVEPLEAVKPLPKTDETIKPAAPVEEISTPKFIEDETFVPFQVTKTNDIKLEVKLAGESKPAIEWAKDNKPLKPNRYIDITTTDEKSTLVIKSPAPGDKGIYKCTATSDTGSATRRFDVDIKGRKPLAPKETTVVPQFIEDEEVEPFDITDEGEISLQVKVSGEPKPQVLWTKDGKPVKQSDNIDIDVDDAIHTLTIIEPTPDDRGTYVCTATSDVGTAVKRFDVEVEGAAPKCTREVEKQKPRKEEPSRMMPKDVKIVQSQSRKTESPPVEPADTPSEETIKVETLTLRDIAAMFPQSKEIELVEVPAVFPKQKPDINLLEFAAEEREKTNQQPKRPEKRKLPVDENIKEDKIKSVELEIEFPSPDETTPSKAVAPSSMKDKPVEPVKPKEKEAVKHKLDEETASQPVPKDAVTKKAKRKEEAEEKLSVLTEIPTEKALLPIDEISTPQFVEDDSFTPFEVTQTNDIKLQVKLSGETHPEIQWSKDNKPLKPSRYVDIQTTNDLSTVVIRNPSPAEKGTYTCTASSETGSATRSFDVEIKGRKPVTPTGKTVVPQFIKDNEVVPFEVSDEGEINLQVKVAGKPTPKVTWTKNGRPIKPSDNIDIDVDDDIHTLTIVEPTSADQGTYTCTATSDAGTSLRSFEVDIEGVAPKQPTEEDIKRVKAASKEVEVMIPSPKETRPLPPNEEEPVKPKPKDVQVVKSKPKPVEEAVKPEAVKPMEQKPDARKQKPKEVEIAKPKPSKHEPAKPRLNEAVPTPKKEEPVKPASEPVLPIEEISTPQFVEDDSVVPFEVTKTNDVKMQIKVAGEPRPTIEWSKDNKPLKPSGYVDIKTEEDLSTLTIKNPGPGDQGTYKCTASSETGEATRSFDLDIKGRKPVVPKETTVVPQFIEDEEVVPFEVTDEGEISLQVKVAGKPKPTITWTKDGKPIEPSDNIDIDVDDDIHTLTIVEPTPDDQGTYTCTATSDAGTSIRSFEVDIEGVAPKRPAKEDIKGVKSAPKEVEVVIPAPKEIRPVESVAPIPKEKEPVKPKSKDEQAAKPKMKPVEEFDKLETVKPKAHTPEAQVQKQKPKEVEAVKPKPSEHEPVKPKSKQEQPIKPSEKPVLLVEEISTPQFVEDGSVVPFEVTRTNDVKMQVKVAGEPKPSIEWSKDHKPLKPSRYIDIKTEEDLSTLTIKNPGAADQGTYKCTASSETGEVTRSFDVDIKGRKPVVRKETTVVPQFIEDEEMVPFEVTDEGEINLQVKVSGKPQPEVIWTKDGKPIKPSDNIDIDVDDDIHTLTIVEPIPDDQGTYTCTATSDAGTSIRSFEVNSFPTVPSKEEVDAARPIPEKIEEVIPVKKVGPRDESVKHDGEEAITPDEVSPAEADVAPTEKKILPQPQFVQDESISPFEVTPQGDVKLKAKVSGEPVPEVVWTKDKRPIKPSRYIDVASDADEHILTIKRPTPADRGVYECVATNDNGTASRAFDVQMKGRTPVVPTEESIPPHFVLDDTVLPVEVTEKGDITLSAKLSGAPKPQVKWFKDGRLLKPSKHFDIREEENTYTLTVKKPTDLAHGVYRCLAESNSGTVSRTFEVEVQDLQPSVLDEAAKLTEVGKVPEEDVSIPKFVPDDSVVPFEIKEDGSVKMQLKVSGKPKPVVEWSKDNRTLQPSKNVKIAETDGIHSLIITNPTPEDQGTYKCTAKSKTGTTTRTFDVDVTDGKPLLPTIDTVKPRFLEDDSIVPFEVTEDGDIKLKVKVSGKPRPVVEWLRNEKPLRPERNIELEVEEDVYTLTIKRPTSTDQGTYKCKAISDTGTAVRSFEVDVEGARPSAPKEDIVSTQFVHDDTVVPFSVTESGDVKLQAKIAGKPEPVVEWTKDGQPLKPSPRIEIITKEGHHTVTIKNPTFKDEGNYKCTATNDVGTATRTFEVEMKGRKPVVPKETIPPQFLRDDAFVPFELTPEGNVNMKVKVEGNPKPTLVWSKDGKTLKPGDHLHIHTVEDTHTLTISRPTEADQGTYKCTATNKSGTATRTFEVDVEAVMPTMAEPAVPSAVTPEMFTNTIRQEFDKFGDVRLHIKAPKEPGTTIEWFKGGKPITHSSHLDIKRTRDDVYTLTIKSPKSVDKGLYTFKATNKSGKSTTQSIEVDIKGTQLSLEEIYFHAVRLRSS